MYEAVCTNDIPSKKIKQFTCNRSFKPNDYNHCNSGNSVTQKRKGGGCGPNNAGIFYEIGIQIPGALAFVKFFRICFNENTESVYFSQQKISKSSLEYPQKSYLKCKTWNNFGYRSSEAQIKDAYSIVYGTSANPSGQLKRFQKIFGGNLTKAKEYINSDPKHSQLYLARGHLSAHVDQPFDIWRKATYALLNQVPQWHKINGGSWVAVENHVRKMSTTADIFVTTGGHDQLEIENEKISLLNGNCMQVPKYIWKIVESNDKTGDEMAFTIRNFPYENNFPDLCNDRQQYCSNNFKQEYFNISAGFLTCCSVAALKKAIGYDPKIHFR